MEELEKRIKSRFSSKEVLFTPPKPEVVVKILQDRLKMLPEDNHVDEGVREEWNAQVERIISIPNPKTMNDGTTLSKFQVSSFRT